MRLTITNGTVRSASYIKQLCSDIPLPQIAGHFLPACGRNEDPDNFFDHDFEPAAHASDLLPDAPRRHHGFAQRPLAQRLEPVKTLCAPPSLRRRIGEPGGQIAFILEPVERDINRAERNVFRLGQIGDFGMNGDTISIVAQRQNRGEHELFELTDGFRFHLPYIVRQMTGFGGARRAGRVRHKNGYFAD